MTANAAAAGDAVPGHGAVLVADVMAVMAARYPLSWALDWDRVGLVVGEPDAPVTDVLLAVDCVAATVDEAERLGAQLMITHHPLLLRGVHSVSTDTYKGALVHRLIRAGVAVYTAHTNADVAAPGVGDALAARLALRDATPLVPAATDAPAPIGSPASSGHPGRLGWLPEPMSLSDLITYVHGCLPATVAGVRGGGDPGRRIETLAVVGGAGDAFLTHARAAGADAYLTSDLRHHVASEHLEQGGPALVDAPHWATERPWLDLLADQLRVDLPVRVSVSDIVTDVWTVRGVGL